MKPRLKLYKIVKMTNPDTFQEETIHVWTDGVAYFSLKNPHVRFLFNEVFAM